LYRCETWSPTLREEHRLRVFENRVLRRIFGPKRDEVTREWRKLHNEELHNLYSSPNIIRQVKSRSMIWAGHVACIGEERKVCKVSGGKARRKEITQKTEVQMGGWDQNGFEGDWIGGVEWIRVTQNRDWWLPLVKAVMNFWFLVPRS
jgi:hypothetical protein